MPKPRKPDEKKLGRPTLCTPAVTAAIVALVEEGIAFKTSCEANHISERDGHNWLVKGENGLSPYAAFYSALTCAKAWGEIKLHRGVVAGDKGSAMKAWILERRFREHYGPPKSDIEQPEVKIVIVGGLPRRP